MTLKFYSEERRRFPELFNRDLTVEECIKIFNELCDSYDEKLTKLEFHGWNTSGGQCVIWKRNDAFSNTTIRLPNKSNMGCLLHEFAHVMQLRNEGKTGHNKGLMEWIEILDEYAQLREYWGIENLNPVMGVDLNDDNAVIAAVIGGKNE